MGALGSRVPEPKAGELAEKLVAEMRQRKDPDELFTLARALGSLGSRVPDPKVAEAAEELVAEMRQRKDPDELSTLARALGSLGMTLSDAKAREVLTELLTYMQSMPSPNCGAIAGLFRKQQTRLVLDVMKWPICDSTDLLVQRIGELEDVSFKDEGKQLDLARFYDWLRQWAEKNHYDLDAPPRPPQLF
jgi:hypothetical protein